MHLMTCKKFLKCVTRIGPAPYSNLNINSQVGLRVKSAKGKTSSQLKRWKYYVQEKSEIEIRSQIHEKEN